MTGDIIAPWITYLLPHPAASGSNHSSRDFFGENIMTLQRLLVDSAQLWASGRIVDYTHSLLASSKQVLPKKWNDQN